MKNDEKNQNIVMGSSVSQGSVVKANKRWHFFSASFPSKP